MGCVLSVAATWVIVGSIGVYQYYLLRGAYTGANSSGSREYVSYDGFHDGSQVRKDVLDWHDYLRASRRQSDTITGHILDLVEQKMLLGNPSERCDAASVCDELAHILEQSRLTTSRPTVAASVLHALSLTEIDISDTDYTNAGLLGQQRSYSSQSQSVQLASLIPNEATHRSAAQILDSPVSNQQKDEVPGVFPFGGDRPSTRDDDQQSWSDRSTLVDEPTLTRMKWFSPPEIGAQNVWQARYEMEQKATKDLFRRAKKDGLLAAYYQNSDTVSPFVPYSQIREDLADKW